MEQNCSWETDSKYFGWSINSSPLSNLKVHCRERHWTLSWAHAARMVQMRDSCEIWPGHRWEENIKMVLKQVWSCELDWSGVGWSTLVGFCEHSNESSDFIRGGGGYISWLAKRLSASEEDRCVEFVDENVKVSRIYMYTFYWTEKQGLFVLSIKVFPSYLVWICEWFL
jgi:hypothetical protein